jgi:hypothetical protein
MNIPSLVFVSSLKGVWHDIFDFSFFHESVSPRPPSIPLGLLWIFSKIRGDIPEWIFIAGVNDTSDKLFSGVNDTGEKFFAGVNDTAEKLFTGVNDTGDKLFGGVNDTGV